MLEVETSNYPIPVKLNIIIFFVSLVTGWYLLWVASHTSILYMLMAAFIFALIHNTFILFNA